MTDTRREIIEHWVGDFCSSTAFQSEPPVVREHAAEVLVSFLQAACAARNVEPDDVEAPDMKPGLLEGVARLKLPKPVLDGVPALCAAFLAAMEDEGRLSGGRQLGFYLRALQAPFLDAASGTPKPIVTPTKKVGRNNPCPCGSGRKYKKCCMNALD